MSADRDGDDVVDDRVLFDEAEDYVERRRQKEILDAAQTARETLRGAAEEFDRGEIDVETYRALVRTDVEHLIRNVKQVIKMSGEEKLLHEDPSWQVVLQPPQSAVNVMNNSQVDTWGDVELRPKAVHEIKGIMGYKDAPKYFRASWDINVNRPDQEPQPESHVTTQQMPVEVSDSVRDAIETFLAESKLDLTARLDDYTGDSGPGL